MRSPLARLVDRSRCSRTDRALRTAAVARRLEVAIEEAVARGRVGQAIRIAETAAPLAGRFPQLAAVLARLWLEQEAPGRALQIIEDCRCDTRRLRLLRAIALMQQGRDETAAAQLKDQADGAPTILSALLRWRQGDRDGAVAALQPEAAGDVDRTTAALLMTLHAQGNAMDDANGWADRLESATAFGPDAVETELMVRSLTEDGQWPPADPPAIDDLDPETIETLATELIDAEPLIPALVEGLVCGRRLRAAQLLQLAIVQALPGLSTPAVAEESVGRLLLLLEEPQAARQWAWRALQRSPMSATAALLARQCNDALFGLQRSAPTDVLATIGAPREVAA